MARATFPRTITRGPLAGQYFTGQMEYMNARSRYFGFRSYADERSGKQNPFFTVAFENARNRGEDRTQAMQTAKRVIRDSRIRKSGRGTYAGTGEGAEMSRMIQRMYAERLYDPGDDVNESDFYE